MRSELYSFSAFDPTGPGSQVFRSTILFFWVSIACLITAIPDQSPWALENDQGKYIVVYKSRHLLQLYEKGKESKTYRVCLGLNPFGSKMVTGDKRTPEGAYYICLKNKQSKYHRFLGISYPGARDARLAFLKGLIGLEQRAEIERSIRRKEQPPWNTRLGGWVGIHGYPSDARVRRWMVLLMPKPVNWTDGCIALWNHEIEELYSRVEIGVPVTILP